MKDRIEKRKPVPFFLTCKAILPLSGILFSLLVVLNLRGISSKSNLNTSREETSPRQSIVVSSPESPFRELAEDIAADPSYALKDTLELAFSIMPEAVIWVVAPSELDERSITAAGLTWQAASQPDPLGIITGNTLSEAQALWERKLANAPIKTTRAIPREGIIVTCAEDRCEEISFSKASLFQALIVSDYITYQGGGTASAWWLGESQSNTTLKFTNDELPGLRSALANGIACQTMQFWRSDSIALGFLQQGAAAYLGFVHSPIGFLFGEPSEFPYQYTWSDFTIGHVNRLQNESLLQGSLQWPFYFLIGNPQSAFRIEPPYKVISDKTSGNKRTISFSDAPAGVLPVRIEGGAAYPYVRVLGISIAWEGDKFYDAEIQMMNLYSDKFLMFRHPGGDFSIELSTQTPFYVPVFEPLIDLMDRAIIFFHIEGSVVPFMVISAVALLVGVGCLLRMKLISIWGKQEWIIALSTSGSMVLLHGIYLLLRWEYLTVLFENYIRTMDVRLDVNISYFFEIFLLCGLFAVLTHHATKWWGKAFILLMSTLPSFIATAVWCGLPIIINIAAQERYDMAIYKPGNGAALASHWAFQLIIMLFAALLYPKILSGLKYFP